MPGEASQLEADPLWPPPPQASENGAGRESFPEKDLPLQARSQ